MDRLDTIRELVKTPGQLVQVMQRTAIAVRRSFEEDRRRSTLVLLSLANPSQAEIKRRAEICYSWFVRLRTEHGYSTDKALDHLPRALRGDLDGTPWTPPPAERGWSPEESNGRQNSAR